MDYTIGNFIIEMIKANFVNRKERLNRYAFCLN